MMLTWYGHACFLLEFADLRVLTDPYDDSVGYPPLELEADAITISHHHHDHDNVAAVRNGDVKIIEQSMFFKNARFVAMDSYHDEKGGALRGKNRIFTIEMGGLRVVHLGDLGEQLSTDQIEQLGQVDILLVPVGGKYTLNAVGAAKLVKAIDPDLVIPMHYKTPYVSMEIAYVEDFLECIDGREIVYGSNRVELTPQTLPEKGVLVMAYE